MEKRENKYLKQYKEKVKDYEKFSKKNYLMANIFFECLERKKNFYEIMAEIAAYVKTLPRDEWAVNLNPELVVEYFALSLGCSGKAFFRTPEETIKNFFKNYSLTYSDYDVVRDDNNKIVRISIPMEIDSVDYGDDADSSITKSLVDGKWQYSICVSPPDRMLAEIEDVEEYYIEESVYWWLHYLTFNTRNCIHIDDENEVIKEEFESNFDWKECLLRHSYDDDRFEIWISKLKQETLGNKIDWVRFGKEEPYRWFRCTLGNKEVCIQCFNMLEKADEQVLIRPDQLALYLNEDNIICFEEGIELDDWGWPKDKNYSPNEKIRALAQIIENYLSSRDEKKIIASLPVKELKYKDVLIHSGSMYCKMKGHNIIPYRGLVPILTDDKRKEVYELYVGYCTECKTYTAFRSDYVKMLEVGHPLCKVFAYEEAVKAHKEVAFKYKSQSVLAALGYNVQEKVDLSQEQRKEILKAAMDADIVEVPDVVEFLNWLIVLHEPQNKKYGKAITKWKEDISFVEEYRKEERDTIVVDTIRVKK